MHGCEPLQMKPPNTYEPLQGVAYNNTINNLICRYKYMANTLVKIDIHLIFHVKSTGVSLQKETLPELFRYIGGVISNIGGIPIEIGGMPDHIHILSSLPKTMSLADFARAVKANSSRWINQQTQYHGLFKWQEGYGAFSVSPSLIEKTVNYIRTQEEHHRKHTFREEYISFLQHYNIEFDDKYLLND